MEIMKAVIDVSHFIYKFVNKGQFSAFLRYPFCIRVKFNGVSEKFGAAQIDTKLNDHRSKLVDLREKFNVTLTLQNTVHFQGIADGLDKLVEDVDEQSECKRAIPDVIV